MKSKVLLFGLALAALASCQKSNDALVADDTSQEKDVPHVCVDKDLQQPGGPQTEAAGLTAKFWPNGKTITVKFLNGTSFVQNKVIQFARQWESYANIRFSFVAANQPAEIRIGFQFNGDGGSWSYIGKDAVGISASAPTMNFGWFNANTSDTEFRRTTVHEFGHAIGLIHEQSSPVANIPWNKEAVYNYYAGPPNYWSRSQVDYNVFFKYGTSGTQYSQYDPASIMHYPVPAAFTTNGFSVGNNTQLSTLDKQFIAKIYPK
ncbi:matrixin family metalloprotease [Chitinophaga pendula]|uniref:matrixin family metalloprotease n=1 Tax=Chitinophaga TaxID=79328 RepID=UPI000BAF220F|nr:MULTISPECIES: matrixin family metalloprotease [Chitinophaga]ASZ13761.1 peptidase M12 [Chitinophaga sp. MD30]UCJ08619.1 matrixin family metalloprotease [Chitinophaga pendula]